MNVDRPKGILTQIAATAMATLGLVTSTIAQNANLATRNGHDLGVSLTSYKYTEPGVMTLKANKVGFDYSGTIAIGSEWPNRNNGWFVRGDLRYATGKTDYSSSISGTIDNRIDWYYEVRGLFGKDFDMGNYVLAPYVGLGFRHLFNDLRGRTSTGASGYRRESDYTTLPIGVIHKMTLSSQSQLHTTLEYSPLLRGRQEVKLTDSNPLTPDVSLRQRSGYGLRLGTMVRYQTWSVGPTLTVWRVKQSESGGTPAVFEPQNSTYEFGVKAAMHF